ncbi:MAG TPA: NAD-dependent epimerase/dehydratase family protein [Steroidobacteraceae bacterium]|jgi:uncharacterized protein YbjT (DUF2867 family)|nr:NAD-dependent epimerase/dehydratase family protein [Steroidobacteraceae bacterium]
MADQEPRVALLAGASGLVGGYVLDALLDAPDFGRVYAVTRRPLGREHSRIANRIVQFDKIEAQLKGTVCHVAFCCLGTTLKQAGSEQAFRQVDFDYVLAFARAARVAQAQRFVVVSSAGANPQSKNFYLRVKGEMERALESLQFPSLDILQPGPLLGWRPEIRPRELAATILMPLLNPLLGGTKQMYRGISARTVAAAAVGAARSGRRGVYRYTYPALQALAASKPVRVPPPVNPKLPSGAR